LCSPWPAQASGEGRAPTGFLAPPRYSEFLGGTLTLLVLCTTTLVASAWKERVGYKLGWGPLCFYSPSPTPTRQCCVHQVAPTSAQLASNVACSEHQRSQLGCESNLGGEGEHAHPPTTIVNVSLQMRRSCGTCVQSKRCWSWSMARALVELGLRPWMVTQRSRPATFTESTEVLVNPKTVFPDRSTRLHAADVRSRNWQENRLAPVGTGRPQMPKKRNGLPIGVATGRGER
jgi:hypothetical protein